MKKIVSILLLFIGFMGYSQTNGITYQAVIFNPSGEQLPGVNNANAPLANKNICLRFTIIDHNSQPEYIESIQTTTDEFGMVNLIIGTGLQLGGYATSFSNILWNANPKNLKVDLSATGVCAYYTEISNQPFTSVPFALYAVNSESTAAIAALQATVAANATATTAALATKENTANKSITTTLGTSNVLFPTQNAVKTYVDTNISTVNASTTALQATVAANAAATTTALGLKEDAANKSTTTTLGTSNVLFPTQNAVKTYVDTNITNVNASNTALQATVAANAAATTTALGLKEDAANKSTTTTLGTSNVLFPTQNAVKTYVDTNITNVNASNTAAITTLGNTVASNAAATTTALGLKEDAANKSTTTTLGTSNVLFPTQNAVKTYVDSQVASATIPDANATTKGKIKLAGDLGGTADVPTVPGLALKANTSDVTTSLATKEDASNKSNATLGTSTTLFPTQNAVKTYVDAQVASATIADATTIAKGKIQLSGDLGGTADVPTVPGLALKANTSDVTTSLATKEDASNKSNATLGTSTTLFPTQNAVKTYVDNQIASATIVDADATTKGKVQLAGDLGGSAAAPTVPGLALKAPLASPIFTGAVTAPIFASTPQALTDAATIVWNPANGLNASVTLGGNRTLSFTATPAVGSYGTLIVTQDATGGRTINLPSTSNKVLGSTSTTTIALSSAANAKDILNFYYDGTNCYWNIGQGYGTAATVASTNLASGVSGTLPVANGGTGAATLTGYIKGNGTSAMTANASIPVADVTGAAPLASPTFTGTPVAPTATAGTNTTQIATTEFVTGAVASATITDATTSAKGKVKLAGDLGGTADVPTVPGLALKANTSDVTTSLATKEDASNKSNSTLGTSTTLFPTQNAVKTYVDNQIASATIVDADATTKGKVQLAGDLGGTAAAPTVPGLALKANTSDVTTSLATKEDASNKSNATLGTSTTLFPTQNAVKTYVDAQVASATIADATTIAKGKLQLAGDLAGTAAAPTVPGLALKAPIASPTFTGTVTAPIFASTPQALTDAATISWNPANGLNASVTLAGNRTLSFSSTPAVGSYGTLIVSQDATGGRTINLPSTSNKVLGSTSTTTIALSSAANAKDILNFYYDGTNCYWNIGQGYGTAATVASTNLTSSVSGTLLIANGGTGATTKATAFDALSPMTSSGDIIYGGLNGTGTRLSKGSNGSILTMENDLPTWNTSIKATPGSSYNAPVGFSFIGGDWARNTGMFSDNPDAGGSATLKFRIATSNSTANSYLEINPSKVSVLPTTASTSKTTGALTVAGGLGVNGDIYTNNLNASGTVTAGSVTYPNAHGSANQVLSTTGSGTLTWITPVSSAASLTGTLAVANGGTGATTAAAALTSLGAQATANLSTDISTDAASTSKYPAVKTIKDYVDAKVVDGITDAITTSAPSQNAVFDALALKANATDVTSASALKEDTANKSTTTTLGTSDVLFPTQNAVKTYVDAQVASATIVDADASTKGKIQLAGDLGGTNSSASAPIISADAITTVKIINSAVTSDKIADGAIVNADINTSAAIADTKLATIATSGKVSNSATTATDANTASAIVARDASGNFTAGTITANLTGNATNVTGTVAVANGGTGVATAAANTVFAGPTSGASPAAPSFRGLVAADLPSGSTNYINNTTTQQSASFNISGSGTVGTDLTLSALTASKPVFTDANKKLTSAGTLGISQGGTGLTTTPTNGQILIGNGTGFTLANLTQGTGITISNSNGSISIAAAVRPTTDQFSATANQTTFTLTQTPLTNANSKDNVWMFINGVRTNNDAYSVSGTTVTYVPGSNGSYALLANDRIQFDYTY